MDIGSERLRQDIAKPDLIGFDFGPSSTDNHKTFEPLNNNNNNTSSTNHNSSTEEKETNNNHVTVDMSTYCADVWPSLDTTMLEELNCWSQEAVPGSKMDNTDGAIYTLTVLNGTDSGSWFKTEEKEEKILGPGLDLDSLLNVIPSNFPTPFNAPEAKTDFTFEERFDEKPKSDIVTEIVLTNSTSFNNNNVWKQENNNEVDSLLRNALQGKALARYNGIKKEPPEIKVEEDESMILDNHSILYENPNMVDSDNPSSAQSMDDMFLTHLDVSYPEDYEKLKRLETEVAESVEQFCLDRSYLPSPSSNPPLVNPMISIVNKPTKKYSKRSKSTSSSASSSSPSGVRKERSLHYCSICNKGFKDKYSVNVHIRTHTGEKPFTCSLCGKSFRQKAHLAKHYQTHMAQAKNGISSSSKASKSLISSS